MNVKGFEELIKELESVNTRVIYVQARLMNDPTVDHNKRYYLNLALNVVKSACSQLIYELHKCIEEEN